MSARNALEALAALYTRDGDRFDLHRGADKIGAMDVRVEDDRLHLDFLMVSEPVLGTGVGSRMLDDLCTVADRQGVEIALRAEFSGVLSEENLAAWLGRRGFEEDGDSTIGDLRMRRPARRPEPETERNDPGIA
jgi:GNAT superfamily N-acetyltransferase